MNISGVDATGSGKSRAEDSEARAQLPSYCTWPGSMSLHQGRAKSKLHLWKKEILVMPCAQLDSHWLFFLACLFSILLALCSIIFIILLPSESYVTGSSMVKEFTMNWFGNTHCTISQWCSVGLRSDYEGHWSKEAIKEFKSLILFMGIVYKATCKAMKKKAFILLLCLPTVEHFYTWGWDQKSIILICNEKKGQIFYMLWQYKLELAKISI